MKTKLILFLLLISSYGFSQNGQKSVDNTIEFLRHQDKLYYFEVSEEMFKMLSESKDVSPEFKEYMGKLSKLKMVQTTSNIQMKNFEMYENFINNANLKDFSKLMTSEEPDSKMSFYKKKNGNSENEFLMVSSDAVIYIVGKLDIKSIYEFEEIMEIAGSAFDL